MVYKPFETDNDILKTDSSEDINPIRREEHKKPERQPALPFSQQNEAQKVDKDYFEQSPRDDDDRQACHLSHEEREELIKKTDSDAENLLTPKEKPKRSRDNEDAKTINELKQYIENADKKLKDVERQNRVQTISDEPRDERSDNRRREPTQESQEPDGRTVNFHSDVYQLSEDNEQNPTSDGPIQKYNESDDERLVPEDLNEEVKSPIIVQEDYIENPYLSEREEQFGQNEYDDIASEGET
jgi:hypothetical protein